jgi:hypothetical protein
MMTTINKGSLWPYSSKPYSIHVILFFQLELLISPTKPKKSYKKKKRREREKQEKGKTLKEGGSSKKEREKANPPERVKTVITTSPVLVIETPQPQHKFHTNKTYKILVCLSFFLFFSLTPRTLLFLDFEN